MSLKFEYEGRLIRTFNGKLTLPLFFKIHDSKMNTESYLGLTFESNRSTLTELADKKFRITIEEIKE